MNRRKALEYTASILGVTIVGADAFLSGCARPEKPANLIMEKQIRLLDEIGETILPASERSPGARAAGIGRFMNRMITECYSKEEYRILVSGIDEVEQASKDAHRRGFLKLNIQERHELLAEFDRQARLQGDRQPLHFFSLMKQLTLLGYFTSEIGVTQAMRYNPVPGGYNGCAGYREGDKAWFGPLSSIG
jgi:hypothetical protein